VTIILALSNMDQCVQVSDRQLTDGRGRPYVLPQNKATVIRLADARLICGFAGLARAGRFRIGDWLPNALLRAAQPDHLAHQTVERFTEEISKRFREPDIQSVPRENRRLSFLLTGYRDGAPPPNFIAAVVTNFENFDTEEDELPWDEFQAIYWSAKKDASEDFASIRWAGQWTAMTDADLERAMRVLTERRQPESIVDIGVGIVREMAKRPEVEGTIGSDLHSVILPVHPPEGLAHAPASGHHPLGASHSYSWVNQVTSLPDRQFAVSDLVLKAPSSSSPLTVQRVGRNKRCPCGSGKKYKHCHGA
jgi:ATP-dependent protease HslVU (ClpYQ) peptidase subunit